MAIQIITDTSCDLPDEVLTEFGIDMIPLKVTFENGNTFLDRFQITPAEFVKRMNASKVLPKTSTPDPNTFVEYFKKGIKEAGEVIFLSISSGLSSTFQTAQLACDLLGNNKVKVFDTLTASLGTGIMAMKAAQMSTLGLNVDAVIDKLNVIRDKSENLFILDTLENVVKGGRLKRIEGLAGTMLNIKPIFQGIEGKPEVVEKVRGRKKAISHLLAMIEELAGDDISERIVGVTHVNCEEEAQNFCQDIKERFNPRQILFSDMSATIGTYAGQGGLMVNF